MKYLLIAVGLVSSICSCRGQIDDAINVSGECLTLIERTESYNDAVRRAVDLARVNALEKAFGRVVFQGNSTFVQNVQTGDKVDSKVAFSSVGGSLVNGEWLQDVHIDTSVVPGERPEERYVKIIAAGKARKLPETQANYEVFTASCPDRKCRTSTFNSGQELFIHLTFTEPGYVVIYLDDPQLQVTQKLIPSDNRAYVQVPANQSVIFPEMTETKIELQIAPDQEIESYKLFVLFSPRAMEQPVLRDLSSDERYISREEREKGYLVPLSIESERFQRWMQEFRMRNKGIQLETLVLGLQR